jgi:hypothetical protein
VNQQKTNSPGGTTVWIGEQEAEAVRFIRDNWEFPGPRPSFNAIVRQAVGIGAISIGDSVRKYREAMRADSDEQDGLADNRDAMEYGSQRGGPNQ